MKDFFELGRVLKPQGIRGEVKTELYSDVPQRVELLETIYFKNENGDHVPVQVTGARSDDRFGYLYLEGVKDRDQAEKYRDRIFFIDREHALPLPEGAFYISDLLGLPVFRGDDRIGVLKDILQTGSKDIYVVGLEEGGTLMFPSVDGVFVERSPEKGRIVVDADRLEEVGISDV